MSEMTTLAFGIFLLLGTVGLAAILTWFERYDKKAPAGD